jgi:hypothetical protein
LEGNQKFEDTVTINSIKEGNADLDAIVALLLNEQKMYKISESSRECEGYRLNFVMEQKSFPRSDHIMELLGGITFGLIPFTETYDWYLNVSLADKSRLLKIYEFNDGMKRYMETLLLPVGLTPYYGKSATQNAVWRNMVTHALNRIAVDIRDN